MCKQCAAAPGHVSDALCCQPTWTGWPAVWSAASLIIIINHNMY